MKNRLWYDNLYRPKGKYAVLGKEVPIESPNQFVPLFVIQISPDEEPLSLRGLSYRIDAGRRPLITLPYVHGVTMFNPDERNLTKVKERIRTGLSWLVKPCPKSYNLTTLTNVSMRRGYISLVEDSNNQIPVIVKDNTTFCGLGLMGASDEYYSTDLLSSPLYPTHRAVTKLTPPKVKYLVLVKAKHIPYLRVCIWLKLPITKLPYGDIRILYDDTLYFDATQSGILSRSRYFAMEEQFELEKCDYKTLNDIVGLEELKSSIAPEELIKLINDKRKEKSASWA